MAKLTARGVETAKPGRHADGDGLFLLVKASGARSWLLRYQAGGVRRDMGLGGYPAISLKEARALASEARRRVAGGNDPIIARKAERQAGKPIPTFGEIAALVVADAQAKTGNAKVAYQWGRHLGPAYCGPFLARHVNEIATTEVAAHLRPLWKAKPEVCRKLYPAIRRVFDRAVVILRAENGIAMENPAAWALLKAQGFEAPAKLTRGHHPALSHERMRDFMAALRQREAVAARALEFTILTCVRTDAALKARWSEFDLGAALWTVPLERLKDRKHRGDGFRVPLSPRAAELLEEMAKAKVSDFVFPGQRGAPMSNMAMLTLLRRMGGAGEWTDATSGKVITAHGFRATFRTWAEEATGFPHAVVEEALGHVVGSAVERAYRRTDLLEKRRELMAAWASYCAPVAPGNVVPLKKAGA